MGSSNNVQATQWYSSYWNLGWRGSWQRKRSKKHNAWRATSISSVKIVYNHHVLQRLAASLFHLVVDKGCPLSHPSVLHLPDVHIPQVDLCGSIPKKTGTLFGLCVMGSRNKIKPSVTFRLHALCDRRSSIPSITMTVQLGRYLRICFVFGRSHYAAQ